MRSTNVHRSFLRTAALIAVLAAASCGDRLPKSLPMELNPVFSGGIGWIVVSQAYVRIKSEPRAEASDVGHLRGGDVLAVQGREQDPRQGGSWYRVGLGGVDGWLKGDYALFFETRAAAERAAGGFK